MREQKEICAVLEWGDFLLVTVQFEVRGFFTQSLDYNFVTRILDQM